MESFSLVFLYLKIRKYYIETVRFIRDSIIKDKNNFPTYSLVLFFKTFKNGIKNDRINPTNLLIQTQNYVFLHPLVDVNLNIFTYEC